MEHLTGKFVILRDDKAGVYFGIIVSIRDNKNVELKNARKIRYWEGAYTTEDISQHGINPITSQVTCVVEQKILGNFDSIDVCSEKAIECLINTPVWSMSNR